MSADEHPASDFVQRRSGWDGQCSHVNHDHGPRRINPMNRLRRLVPASAASAASVLPFSAHASFLPPEMMDSVAMGLAWFVLIAVPIGGIVLFWMVHVLPEKIAHKRHHPQRDAIQVLCLLSLVFGGLLWPIAWLWAYVKPVTYKMAYGTDKHEDYFHEMTAKAKAGELLDHELAYLREEFDAMAAKDQLPPSLKLLRKELDALPGASSAAGAATAGAA
jgi:FAD/FMN-containing dehydrogenase